MRYYAREDGASRRVTTKVVTKDDRYYRKNCKAVRDIVAEEMVA